MLIYTHYFNVMLLQMNSIGRLKYSIHALNTQNIILFIVNVNRIIV